MKAPLTPPVERLTHTVENLDDDNWIPNAQKKLETLTATLDEVNATLKKEYNLDVNGDNISSRQDVLEKLSGTQRRDLQAALSAYDQLTAEFRRFLSSLPPDVRKDVNSFFREHLANFMENTGQSDPHP